MIWQEPMRGIMDPESNDQDNYGGVAHPSPVPQPDDSFSDDRLNRAAVETVGKQEHQGIAPTDHNSGSLSFYGPIDRGMDHNSEQTANGYGRVS